MNATYEQLRSQAASHGQEHLFQYWQQLSDTERDTLLADIERIDFACVQRLTALGKASAACAVDPATVSAPDAYPADPDPEHAKLYADAVETGSAALSEGKVAAMVVAGGQGTRLGFDGPKGTFPISPVKHKTLFELFAESILATGARYGCSLPWYVMTSAATDADTRAYFEANDYLGLDREHVRFFEQGVMPAVDHDGRILLAEKHRVALSPNGHGGSLMALRDSGVLDEMRERGVEVISYFQVDNPLVSPADPLFIGLHRLARSQVSSIAVPKADDVEKVGNFVHVDGKLQVIEYSDLPESLARKKNADGSRMLNAGSVAIHLLDRSFVEQLTSGGELELPWHIARKKVPHIDIATGKPNEPDKPNATKFETFIFDAIPLASRTILLTRHRRDCFSPVKNASGIDSADTARRDMVRRAIRWLEQTGAKIPANPNNEPTATVEISPTLALDARELAAKLNPLPELKPGDKLYLA